MSELPNLHAPKNVCGMHSLITHSRARKETDQELQRMFKEHEHLDNVNEISKILI